MEKILESIHAGPGSLLVSITPVLYIQPDPGAIMGLLDLPPELLGEIISCTPHLALEAFALSCKTVYRCANSRILRHNTLKRRWRHAEITASTRTNALAMLYEISRDPEVAKYVESLNFWPHSFVNLPQSVNLGDLDEFRMDDEAMERVRRLVAESGYLEKAGVEGGDWWRQILNEDDIDYEEDDDADIRHTVISILSLLPNLRTLTLPPGWEDVHTRVRSTPDTDLRLTSVLDVVVEHANGGDRHRPLQHLEAILPYMREGYEERAGLQGVEPFLSLNSLRELYAISAVAVDDGYTGLPFQWRHQDKLSQLRRVELPYSCINAEGLAMLVSHTPQLQCFRYSHQTKWHGCEHDWNAGAFVETLARHCSGTITDLALTVDECYGDIINGASSFLSFSKIQYLEVDVLIFCGPPVESGEKRGIASYIPPGQRPWTEEDIPCIGSMLPDDVVEVHINTLPSDSDRTALDAVLKNLVEHRSQRLKKLEEVTVRQVNENDADEIVEKSGVRVEIWPSQGMDQSMMPKWKRGFQDRVGRIEFTQ
jgi:hypothetical protein